MSIPTEQQRKILELMDANNADLLDGLEPDGPAPSPDGAGPSTDEGRRSWTDRILRRIGEGVGAVVADGALELIEDGIGYARERIRERGKNQS